MTSLNISLPEALKAYIEGEVAAGDYGTPSEFIREIVRQHKERKKAELEQKLLAGLRSGSFEISMDDVRKKGIVRTLRERRR